MPKEWIKFRLPMPEQLTVQQKILIKIDLADPKRKWWGENLIVQWYGGTGKTVVAYYRALSWQNWYYKNYTWEWTKVLLLCYNKLLNSLLKSEEENRLNCDIFHLQELYRGIRNILCKKLETLWDLQFLDWKFTLWKFHKKNTKNEYHYIKYLKWNWEIIAEIIDRSRLWFFANEQSLDFLNILFDWYVDYNWWKKPYKEIIIDEWQDMSKNILRSIQKLTDHISIFADDHQNTQWWSSLQDMKQILSPKWNIEILTNNMRTTKEIFEYAVEMFLPEDEQAHAMESWKSCTSIPDSKPDINSWLQWDNKTWHENIIKLIEENQENYSNILVVCPKWKQIIVLCEQLSKNNIKHGVYYSGIERDRKSTPTSYVWVGTNQNILVTTYISAKWLEAECVILYISREEYIGFLRWTAWDKNDNIFYTLSTRPRKKLLFVTDFSLSEFDD